MDWTTVENAIHAWISAATGLATDRVLWRDQSMPQPSGSYVTLKILALTAVGHDGLTHTFDPNAEPGKEITFATEGRRRLALSVQAYSDALTGEGSAAALLAKVQDSLGLPTTREALNAAKLGAFNAGAITDLSALRETRFQSRAAMTVEFHTVASATASTTYIETVGIEREVLKP